MKNLFLAFAVLLGFSAFTLTGCGGKGETTVVQPDPDANSSMSAADQAEYEKQMQEQYGSSPGN